MIDNRTAPYAALVLRLALSRARRDEANRSHDDGARANRQRR